jgi:hypothetical protein
MQRGGKRLNTRSIDLGQIFVAVAEKYQERRDNVLAPGKYLLSNFCYVPLSSAGLAANAEKSMDHEVNAQKTSEIQYR